MDYFYELYKLPLSAGVRTIGYFKTLEGAQTFSEPLEINWSSPWRRVDEYTYVRDYEHEGFTACYVVRRHALLG